MARETKVGLLAGLTFIVVFAVILANRGREDPLLSQKSLSTDGQVILSERFVPTESYEVRRGSRAFPTEQYRLTPTTPPPPTTPIGINGTLGAGDLIAAEGVSGKRNPAHTTPPRTRAITFGTPGESGRSMIASGNESPPQRKRKTSQRGLYETVEQFASQGNGQVPGVAESLDQPGIDAPQEAAAAPLTLQRQVPSQVKRPEVSGTKYVVLSGDTLYAIAGKHYGKRSGKFVRAIVEANGDSLPDPNRLRVGAVLVLPAMEVAEKIVTTAASARAGRDPGVKTTAKTAAKKSQEFDWYQIQEGDRYASIARKQLGDATRWREVFELNKEKFPDPDRIRDGVLIKIPKLRGGGEG